MGNHDRIAMGKIPIFMGSTSGSPYAPPMKLSGVGKKKKKSKKSCMRLGRITNNPFLNFLREYRKTHCGRATRIVADAAKRWNRMSTCEKERFRLVGKRRDCQRRRRRRRRSGGSCTYRYKRRRRRSSCRRRRRRRRRSTCRRRRRRRTSCRRRRPRRCPGRNRRPACPGKSASQGGESQEQLTPGNISQTE